jgi:hypothetical protein
VSFDSVFGVRRAERTAILGCCVIAPLSSGVTRAAKEDDAK